MGAMVCLRSTVVWLVVMVAMAANSFGETRFSCESRGKWAECTAEEAEHYEVLPLWILHTKPAYKNYGLDFRAPSPRDWTLLEMRIYPPDQSGAPYDGVVFKVFRAWIRRCGEKTVFWPYIEDREPPACPK